MRTTDQAPTRLSPSRLVVRALVALALLIDAAVHLHLAPGYQLSAPSGIEAGNLFCLEAAAAMAAAVFVLVRGSRTAYAAAFVIGLSALGAVLLYRYANVPALGPLPAMNEPLWSPEKILSSIAEAFAAVVGAAMLISKVDQAGSVIGRRPGCWPDLEDDHWSTGQEGGSPLRATSGVQHLVDSAY